MNKKDINGNKVLKLQVESFVNVNDASQSKIFSDVINNLAFVTRIKTIGNEYVALEMNDNTSAITNCASAIDNGKITFVYYGFAANITDFSNRDDRFAIKKNDSANPNNQFAFSKNGFAGTNYYAPIANNHFANEKIKFESGKMRMQVKNRFYN